ncbi:MAG: hypothetical protein M3P51_14915 [Chloroflexota bacterium]|nr:hypothetical protein [Chloroflexota bacterium]
MAQRSAKQVIGIYTDDPVACRALGLLLRSAGYTTKCLCSTDGLDGVDLVVVGPVMDDERVQRVASSNEVPIFYLAGAGTDVVTPPGVCLPWPAANGELVRAIEAARGATPRVV